MTREECVRLVKVMGESIKNQAEKIVPSFDTWSNFKVSFEVDPLQISQLNIEIHTYTPEIIEHYTT